MTSRGLLIVNADDWGADERTTDAISRCFAARAVTSASAMVFMADSDRAARVARADRLSVGLHLNLTERFSADGVPPVVRARQERLVEYFAGPKWRRWGISPALFGEVERGIEEQLAQFRASYGAEPSHIDGHEHIHQALGVLAARTLPSGVKLRPSFTFGPEEKRLGNRAFRAALNRGLRLRFEAPRYFFDIRDIHPSLGGRGIEEKLALSSGSAVEVMTHPAYDDECAILLGPAWAELLRDRPTGSYDDL